MRGGCGAGAVHRAAGPWDICVSASSASVANAPLIFLAPDQPLVASGALHRLPVASAAVPQRMAELSAAAGLAFAVIPFDLRAPAWVVHAERVRASGRELRPDTVVRRRPAVRGVVAMPNREQYAAAVAQALERIAATTVPGAHKVVLSRRLTVQFDAPIDLVALIERLSADAHATAFCVPLEVEAPGRVLVGASPELLVAKSGAAVWSAPLAGSARRSADGATDRQAADALSRSAKDRHEHAFVVEWIADRLAPHCRTLSVPRSPGLVATASMWHLGTEIRGTLKDATTPSARLALDLHPTPAVCGTPLEFAAATIAALEPFDRRFYGGVVGCSDTRGDGRWMVAIRCAEIDGRIAHLYAGAGVVVGSSPAAEADETAAKLTTMLSALGIDEAGAPVTELR